MMKISNSGVKEKSNRDSQTSIDDNFRNKACLKNGTFMQSAHTGTSY